MGAAARSAARARRCARCATPALRPDRMDEVLLVGGATRMPCVVRAGGAAFGRMPRCGGCRPTRPWRWARRCRRRSSRATPRSKTSSSPTSRRSRWASPSRTVRRAAGARRVLADPRARHRHPGQPRSSVRHDARRPEGDPGRGLPGRARDLRAEPEARPVQADGTCRPGRPAARAVDVRFSYDLNGMLEVDMTVLSTGRRETLVIEQTPGRLTATQIADARKALARLKFHPREALPNTTALARADALYVELVGPPREALGDAIALFRAALDGRDPRDDQRRARAPARNGRAALAPLTPAATRRCTSAAGRRHSLRRRCSRSRSRSCRASRPAADSRTRSESPRRRTRTQAPAGSGRPCTIRPFG